MKAAVRTKYGLPGDLTIKELSIPLPKDDELLIRVRASTVNRTDCHVLSGKPLLMRLFTGIFSPRAHIIGSDFAGQVESVGSAVQNFKTGDKIMGFGGAFGCGSHAEYFTMREAKARRVIISMPSNVTYLEAAACLEGAVYAAAQINFLQPKQGQKALVYGATGAIGLAYVQFLAYYGTYITAVCKQENDALVKSLGAAKTIDYTKDDFTKDNEQYDFVFDAVGKTSFFKCKKLLKKDGLYTSSGGAENLLLVLITPILGSKRVVFSFKQRISTALSFIKDLIEKGKFRPVIDREYPIGEITEAYQYVAKGQKIGNVIIAMDK